MKVNIVGKNITVTQGISDKIHKKLDVLTKYFIIGEDDVANVLVRTYPTKQKIEVTIPTVMRFYVPRLQMTIYMQLLIVLQINWKIKFVEQKHG